ncbi:Flp family type IVb pilin [Zhongshania borealis]|uniref:Flp family type IVb pilin n=1 Tax=Zhongshania borealis TaxID=889488 RepID=A0ABP7WG17_9GAMM
MLNKIISKLNNFKKDESGASAIEYAVMAAILVGVIVIGVGLLGDGSDADGGIGQSFNTIADKMNP